MCEARPGDRCVTDAAKSYSTTLQAYDNAYPAGPAVHTFGPAETSLYGKVRSALNGERGRQARLAELNEMRAAREARLEQERARRLEALNRRAAREDAMSANLAPWMSARAQEETFMTEVAFGY